MKRVLGVLIMSTGICAAVYVHHFRSTGEGFISTVLEQFLSQHSELSDDSNSSAQKNSLKNKLAWQLGDHAVYSYEYAVQGKLQSPDVKNSTVKGPDLIVQGDLHARVLRIDDDAVYLGLQIRDANIQLGENVSEFYFGAIVNVIGHDGKILKQITANELDANSQHFVKEQLNIQSASRPIDAQSSPTWETQESDNIGNYIASYESSLPGKILKTKKKYTSIADKSMSQIDIIQSFADITPGKFWLDTYDAVESVNNANQTLGALTYTETTRLTRKTTEQHANLYLFELPLDIPKQQLIEKIEHQVLPVAITKASVTEREQKIAKEQIELFRGVKFDKVLNELTLATQNAKSHGDTINAIENLKKWLLANPDKSDAIYSALQNTPSPAENISARLIHALSQAAEIPQAQTTLAKIMADDKLPWQTRLQSIVASGSIGNIKDQTVVDTLRDLAFKNVPANDTDNAQISSAGLYALGSLAEHHPDIANQLEGKLIPILNQNSGASPEKTKMALRSLQNMGTHNTATYEKVSNIFRQSQDASVRVTALDMLNEDPTGQYSSIVLNALQDKDKAIRIAAARELQSSTQNASNVIENVMQRIPQETNADVLGELYLTLGSHKKDSPHVRSYLEGQLAHTDAQLTRYVQQALE